MSQVLSTLSEACGGKGSKLNWALVLGGGWLFCMTFDVIWFLRLGYTKLHSLVSPKLALTDEGVIHSICAPTDIDFFCHMNNGRYLRELDFGRYAKNAQYCSPHPGLLSISTYYA